MRTTINIDDHLYNKFYRMAEQNHRTFSQELSFWMEQIINNYEIVLQPKEFKKEE